MAGKALLLIRTIELWVPDFCSNNWSSHMQVKISSTIRSIARFLCGLLSDSSSLSSELASCCLSSASCVCWRILLSIIGTLVHRCIGEMRRSVSCRRRQRTSCSHHCHTHTSDESDVNRHGFNPLCCIEVTRLQLDIKTIKWKIMKLQKDTKQLQKQT